MATRASPEPIRPQTKQIKNVLFFPPPPVPSTSNKKSSGSRLNAPSVSEKPAKESRFTHLSRSNSLRHTVGSSSLKRKRRLEEKQLSPIKLSPRHWILLVLALLSFCALILGFIFADCVALPHANGADVGPSDDLSTYDPSLYARQDSKATDPTPSTSTSSSNSTQDVGGPDGMLSSSTNTNANTTTTADAEANESKRLGFDSPKNLAILLFYTATIPLLTMLHTMLELVMLCCSKRRTPTDDSADNIPDNDSLSNLKSLSLVQNQKQKRSPSARLNSLLPIIPTVSLTASLLLIAGWIIMTSIQLHCEIPIPILINSTATTSSQQLCPIQVRGHYMHGIHELSIVKSVFGYILAVVYVAYAGMCLRAVCMVAKAKKMARTRETATRELEVERETQLKGRGRESVVRFTVDEQAGSVEHGKEKTGVDVGVVEV